VLDNLRKFQDALDQFLDTFFHLPTLLVIALATLVMVWGMYDIGFNFGSGFVQLNSNQGQITLYWANGCCDLEW